MSPTGGSFVCAREKAILFERANSYLSSGYARPGDVFLASSVARVDGFSMLSVDGGALESRFVRLATSKDFEVSPTSSCWIWVTFHSVLFSKERSIVKVGLGRALWSVVGCLLRSNLAAKFQRLFLILKTIAPCA